MTKYRYDSNRRMKIKRLDVNLHHAIKTEAQKEGITIRKYLTDILVDALNEYPENMRLACEPYKPDNSMEIDIRSFPAELKVQLFNLCNNLDVSVKDFVVMSAFKK